MREIAKRGWPLALVVLALAAAPLAADGADDGKKIRIEKKIVHDCEGEECGGEHVRKMIFVGDDGEVEIVGGDGGHVWVGHGDHGRALFDHHGKGGFLGVATTEMTAELRRHFGVPEEAGVLVGKVVDGSAAQTAGIAVGDILTRVGERPIASTGDLLRAIAGLEPGSAVNVELWRGGRVETLGVTLGERPRHRRLARVVHCEDGDCPEIAHTEGLDCGGGECEVEIECRNGDCECVVNGETTDCASLPGFVAPGG